MARKGRHRKGGRVTPKGTRPLGFQPGDPGYPGRQPREPDLLADVRRALVRDHPLALLALASALLAAVEAARTSPLEPSQPAGPSREELVRSLADVDRPETSALLAALAALGSDEVERRRVARTLAGRDHRLPEWLAGMGSAEPCRSTEMTHVLGDGDNVLVGVRFPSGHELTAVVYIDHNLGTLVKDAFVVDEPIGDLVAFMRAKVGDPDTAFSDIPAAEAKARIVDAATTTAITFPPIETETWPACRPLVEWVVGLLPDGGRGYQRPEWSDGDRRRLAERFFASPFASGLRGRDHRDLLDVILWFGCDYGPGDPVRWSPAAVEILLADWIPPKVVADVAYLAKAPAVLRGFVRFCHAERGIPPRLTDETIEAVDHWEPQYQATIRSPRPQGPDALLAALGVGPGGPWEMGDEDDGWHDDGWDDDWDDDDPDYDSVMLAILERAVGGPEALEALDAAPLPDEAFDWTGIPADVHDRVADVLARCDRGCDEVLDAEYRTAARRLLAQIAVNGPEVFRRRGRADTAAAAICWAVGRANDVFDQRRGGLTQKALLAHFGVRQGGISQRAATLLRAGGFPLHPFDLSLGSPRYLVSRRRQHIVDGRRRLSAGNDAGPG
ncbi:MAG: DUF6398 domain-containing protein [Acidimicrobiales bacterium]